MPQLLLQKQYDYYVTHEQDLVSKYNGLYVVISDAMNVFSFASESEAYDFGVKNFGAGHFLLHLCQPDSLNDVQTVNCTF